jgi:predicted PhzF superfamily epimerase YddE/YHI9
LKTKQYPSFRTAFFADPESSGMSEDPITGSLKAALAHWMQSNGQLECAITVAQGTNINPHGRVSIKPNGNQVLIGGDTHYLKPICLPHNPMTMPTEN